MKEVLRESGISDTFRAHSTRGATSTSAAMAGLSLQEVMARAGWSGQSTFVEHYYHPEGEELAAESFTRAMLNQATNMLTSWSSPKYN